MSSSAITGISGLTGGAVSSLNELLNSKQVSKTDTGLLSSSTGGESKTAPFDSLLQSAMDMIKETNDYTNKAAEAELAYAMGITNSTADLQVAQMKANISLQYTVAVRNAVMEAYKEIMQLQF